MRNKIVELVVSCNIARHSDAYSFERSYSAVNVLSKERSVVSRNCSDYSDCVSPAVI